jgi:hypothetical protein
MSVKNISHWSFREISFAVICFAFVLVLQGAIPFVMKPNLHQAVWSMGFAQSFANNPSVFDVFAHDIGIPGPASMAFGLAGAYPASLFLRFGIQAADAYTITAVLWFAVAYLSAIRLGRAFGSEKFIAAFGAAGQNAYPMPSYAFMATVWTKIGAAEKALAEGKVASGDISGYMDKAMKALQSTIDAA